jgi:hypothetical protein
MKESTRIWAGMTTVAVIFVTVLVIVDFTPHSPVVPNDSNYSRYPSPTLPPLPPVAKPTATPGGPPEYAANGTIGLANLTWVDLNLTTTGIHDPDRRTQPAFAYDYKDQYVVMFGGQNQMYPHLAPYFNDTWIFRNSTWTQLKLSVAPAPRRGSETIWDAHDGYLLLFGGSNNTQNFNDTWKFVGGKWTELFSKVSPPARRSFGLAYDPRDNYTVFFGGHAGTPTSAAAYLFEADTWEFSNGQWTKLATHGRPPPIAEPSLAYDPTDGHVILYGGYNNNGSKSLYGVGSEYTFDATWSFLNGTWSDLTPTNTTLTNNETWYPPRSDDSYLEYDPSVNAMVMFGGDYQTPALLDEWAYNHGSWTRVCSSCVPAWRGTDHGAWDPAMNAIVTFGPAPDLKGAGQTWVDKT